MKYFLAGAEADQTTAPPPQPPPGTPHSKHIHGHALTFLLPFSVEHNHHHFPSPHIVYGRTHTQILTFLLLLFIPRTEPTVSRSLSLSLSHKHMHAHSHTNTHTINSNLRCFILSLPCSAISISLRPKALCSMFLTQKSDCPLEFFCCFSLGFVSSSSDELPV